MEHDGKPWRTAYIKEPVWDLIWLSREGLEGNAVADTRYHGGPEMAVCAYPAAHFARWKEDLPHLDIGPGGFGENFTVEGQDEKSVCVGDVFEIGKALVQVSKPREPCSNIAKRWDQPDFVKRVARTGRMGWYLRVLREGHVEAGMEIRPVERPHPEWTVARVYRVHSTKDKTPEEMAALAACEALDPAWRGNLRAWVEG
jgi:MOSC domain-containing protein YiiM